MGLWLDVCRWVVIFETTNGVKCNESGVLIRKTMQQQQHQ